jgi:septal ring factor EnvC (AmiA/AmiB activator)
LIGSHHKLPYEEIAAIKRDLQSVVKSLKALTQKTEKIAKKLNKLEKAIATKKPRAKARVARKVTVKKGTKVTAIDAVLGVMKRSRKGVTTAQIKEKSGFSEKKGISLNGPRDRAKLIALAGVFM